MKFRILFFGLMLAVLLQGTSLAQMIVKEGNSEYLRVTSSGRVGIGTQNPAAQLHTTGGVRLAGIGSTSDNTHVLTVDNNGDVTKRHLPPSVWRDNANIRTQGWGTYGYQSSSHNRWDGAAWHDYDGTNWHPQISYAPATKTHTYFSILTENRVASGGDAAYRCVFTLQRWDGANWVNIGGLSTLDTQRAVTGGGYINWQATKEWNVGSLPNGTLLRVYVQPVAAGGINGDDCQCATVMGYHANQSGLLSGAAFQ